MTAERRWRRPQRETRREYQHERTRELRGRRGLSAHDRRPGGSGCRELRVHRPEHRQRPGRGWARRLPTTCAGRSRPPGRPSASGVRHHPRPGRRRSSGSPPPSSRTRTGRACSPPRTAARSARRASPTCRPPPTCCATSPGSRAGSRARPCRRAAATAWSGPRASRSA